MRLTGGEISQFEARVVWHFRVYSAAKAQRTSSNNYSSVAVSVGTNLAFETFLLAFVPHFCNFTVIASATGCLIPFTVRLSSSVDTVTSASVIDCFSRTFFTNLVMVLVHPLQT